MHKSFLEHLEAATGFMLDGGFQADVRVDFSMQWAWPPPAQSPHGVTRSACVIMLCEEGCPIMIVLGCPDCES